ncbi:MAG: EAL domain-containing response regulator [Gammaproteobacteria bacterium]|nr:EAL domain-containing response regulator [Gammaproteobacteria bacterium]
MSETIKVVIVDDDIDIAELLAEVVGMLGYAYEVHHSASHFLGQGECDADIVLLDLMLPDVDGIEVMRQLAKQRCAAALILMSGQDQGVLHSATELATEHRLNVVASLGKPIPIRQLEDLLCAVAENIAVSVNRVFAESEAPITVADLDRAMAQGELLLHYQPQINLKDGTLHGVEALIRWQHPSRGLVPPGQFIPLAEAKQRMGGLTSIVINQAARQLRQWQEQGVRIPISINVSADNLSSLQLPEQLQQLLQQHQLDPDLLTIEITESALMREVNSALDTLTRLRLKSFQLSIDDFGTGYSSLIQLYRAPFTELKVDQRFIINMLKDREAHVIVEICVLLGQKLGLQVVAEGIEDEETLKAVTALGCDIGQGFHLARPMPPDALAAWLQCGAVPKS